MEEFIMKLPKQTKPVMRKAMNSKKINEGNQSIFIASINSVQNLPHRICNEDGCVPIKCKCTPHWCNCW